MMNFDVFVVIRFCGRRFTANYAFKWSALSKRKKVSAFERWGKANEFFVFLSNHSPFTSVRAFVFGEVIGTMKDLSAVFAAIPFWRFMFACMPQPIVFSSKLATAMIASVRLNCFVCVHMRNVFRFSYKCFCT